MERPKCIVCGRAIAKTTKSIYFYVPGPGSDFKVGDRQGTFTVTLYVAERPANRQEAQRHTNDRIISSRTDSHGRISTIGTWDGESYRDKYFCTNQCAMDQGYASAKHGARFTWKPRI